MMEVGRRRGSQNGKWQCSRREVTASTKPYLRRPVQTRRGKLPPFLRNTLWCWPGLQSPTEDLENIKWGKMWGRCGIKGRVLKRGWHSPVYLRQCFSTHGLLTIWGLNDPFTRLTKKHLHNQMLTKWLIMVEKLQLWSSNQNNFVVGGLY